MTMFSADGVGGQAEAQAAYDEAVNAVFNLQVDCHRHAQPHISKKDGRIKWAMIELWPMQVTTFSISMCSLLLSFSMPKITHVIVTTYGFYDHQHDYNLMTMAWKCV